VIQTRYAGYIVRQQIEIDRQGLNEGHAIPDDLDYAEVPGLSREVAQKLAAQRPGTIGQASRISGVTPAAVSIIMVHLKKRRAVTKAIARQ
jgi:tRNA uridine 5-carboxymethylaminomethyl modification enzyme